MRLGEWRLRFSEPENLCAENVQVGIDRGRTCGAQVRFDNAQRGIAFAMNNSFGFGGNNCSLVFGRGGAA